MAMNITKCVANYTDVNLFSSQFKNLFIIFFYFVVLFLMSDSHLSINYKSEGMFM